MRKEECILASAPAAAHAVSPRQRPVARAAALGCATSAGLWLIAAVWWFAPIGAAELLQPQAPADSAAGPSRYATLADEDGSVIWGSEHPGVPPLDSHGFESRDWEDQLRELTSPPATAAERALLNKAYRHGVYAPRHVEGFQILPLGLLYPSYLAGEKEPRFKSVFLRDTERNRRVWESALGGRAGLLRYATYEPVDPQVFQLDLEGAALARVLPDEPSHMLEAVDFRIGMVGTWRYHETAIKMGYYHISSHLGDEFLRANPSVPRFNYVRDAAILGIMRDLSEDWQVYGEMGYALGAQGGAEPLEFQVGTQYASNSDWGIRGAPFFGINSYVREDFGFRRSMNLVAGWQWLGADTRHRFRAGMQYFNGPSMQYSFPNRHDKLLGGGIWLDF